MYIQITYTYVYFDRSRFVKFSFKTLHKQESQFRIQIVIIKIIHLFIFKHKGKES